MKKLFIWLAVSAIVMLLFPWFTVTIVPADAGMAVCFLLFFAVNPVCSVVAGAFAGEEIKKMWSIPVITAILFLLGVWCFFGMGETTFLAYAGVYLLLGLVSMLISMLLRKKIQR